MPKHPSFSCDADIDQALKQLVEPPAGFSERIIAACHATSEMTPLSEEEFLATAAAAPQPPHARTGTRWRATILNMAAAAAVAILCAGATTLILNGSRQQPVATTAALVALRPGEDGPTRIASKSAAVPLPEESTTADTALVSLLPGDDGPTRIAARSATASPMAIASADAPMDSLQGFSLRDSQRLHASFSGNAAEHAAAASTAGKMIHRNSTDRVKRQELPEKVTQVWLTRGKIPTQKQLDELTSKVPGSNFTLVDNDGERCTTIRIVASDAQLQGIVDTLHDHSGLTLLSPSLPQPGEASAVAFKDKSVVYTMKLLKE